MIDSTAFLLYGHWIKKDEHQNQNRATLFQTEEKRDLVRCEQLREQRRIDQEESKLLRTKRPNGVDDGLELFV